MRTSTVCCAWMGLVAALAAVAGCAQHPATPALKMATAYSNASDPAAALREALTSARSQLGQDQPAFVLFSMNHLKSADARKLLPVIEAELAGVPYLGVGLGSAGYEPLTDKGKGTGGIALLAFGRGFSARVVPGEPTPVQEGWLYQSGQEPRAKQREYAKLLQGMGQRLGEKLADADPRSLILIEGALHQPANYYFMQGFNPQTTKFAHVLGGASGAPAYLIHGGQVVERGVAAVVLSGPFDVIDIGMERLSGNIAASFDQLFANSRKALGDARPIGAILYTCAGWRWRGDEPEQAMSAHLPGVAVYGHRCGGEMGRRWLGDSVIAHVDMGMISILVPRGSATAGPQPPRYAARMASLSGAVDSAEPATSNAGYLTDWLLLGPYRYDFAEARRPDAQDMLDRAFVADEAKLRPAPGANVGGRRWTPYVTDVPAARGPYINLDMAYGYPNFAVAYMGTKVVCDKPMQARLYCGSDDYIKVWVNGRQVIRYDVEPRGSQWDQEQATIELNAGENVIVAKVVDLLNGWSAMVRLTDAQGRPLEVRSVAWRP